MTDPLGPRPPPEGVRTVARRTSEDDARIARLANEVEVTLASVERRRTHLWLVAGTFILIVSLAVVVSVGGSELETVLPETPALRWAFLGVGLAFLIYVLEQERALRRLTRALFDAEILAASLRSRIHDLTTLSRVGRLVNSVLTMESVLEMLLESVFELTGATRGSVIFVDDDNATVAVSAGEGAPPAGTTIPRESGVVGWVVEKAEPVLITGNLSDDQFPGHRERDDAGSSICAPLIAEGRVLGMLAVERPPDVSPFTEIELRSVGLFADQAATAVLNARRYEAQRRTVERLADALERRSEFVATLVHELRTPLTAILGYGKVLETKADEVDEESRTRIVSAVNSQAERLAGMIDEILQVASADAGAEMRRVPLDLDALVEAGAESARANAVAREELGRDIRASIPDDLPPVYGDPEAMRRVLENLLVNAVKYSPAGSPIDVRVDTEPGEVRIHVEDRGQGIPEDELDHVFERFRQSGGVHGSAGLGLYLVRSLVGAHSGRVWVDSTVGEGSTFHVALPVRSRGPAVTASRNGEPGPETDTGPDRRGEHGHAPPSPDEPEAQGPGGTVRADAADAQHTAVSEQSRR